MTLDATARKVAQKNIRKFGKTITYVVGGSSTYDPTTSEAAASASNKKLKAVIENVKRGQPSDTQSAVEVGLKKIILAGLDVAFTPSPGDKFTIDGETFTVVDDGVAPVYSGELIAIYNITGKK